MICNHGDLDFQITNTNDSNRLFKVEEKELKISNQIKTWLILKEFMITLAVTSILHYNVGNHMRLCSFTVIKLPITNDNNMPFKAWAKGIKNIYQIKTWSL